MTDFADFIHKSGTPKITKIRELLRRPDYNPSLDYWKPLRDGIVEFHANGGTDTSIWTRVLAQATQSSKVANYPRVIQAYQRFLRTHEVIWMPAVRADWGFDELTVRVAPELRWSLQGVDYAVKLYMKQDRLPLQTARTIQNLMHVAIGPIVNEDTKMAVLDVQRGAFHHSGDMTQHGRILLEAEASSFIAIWNSLNE